MRLLESSEIVEILPFFSAAILEAAKSPSQKSQRGAVIYRNGILLGIDHNRPKDGRICIPPICYKICGDYCDHAEKNAFEDAKLRGNDIDDATMLHIKIKGMEVKTSDQPSCLKCSTLVASSTLKEFILYTNSGFAAYGAQEFHEETQANIKAQSRS